YIQGFSCFHNRRMGLVLNLPNHFGRANALFHTKRFAPAKRKNARRVAPSGISSYWYALWINIASSPILRLFRSDPHERSALVGSHPGAYIPALNGGGLRA